MVATLRKWLAPPVFEGDEEKTRKANLLNTILLTFFFATVLYSIFAPIDPIFYIRRFIIVGPFLSIISAVWLALRRGLIRFAGEATVFALWALFTIATGYNAGSDTTASTGYFSVVVCAGLLLGRCATIGWAVISIATTTVILGGVERGLLPATANAFSLPTSAFLIAHALFIFSVAILLNLALRNMEESLANTLRALTERRKLERELQEERDFVLQIINTMGQGLFMIDEKGHFMMVNPAYARLTGYELQDLLGKSPADITALEDQETLAQAREAREQGNTTTYENRLKRKDGKFIPVLITGVPRLKDGKYAGSIAVITI